MIDEYRDWLRRSSIPRKYERYAAFLTAFIATLILMAGLSSIVGAVTLSNGVHVTPANGNGVVFDAAEGPSIEVLTETDIQSGNQFPNNDTVDFGPVVFSGGDNASAAVRSLNGTWTNLTNIALNGESLVVNPNDKQQVELSGSPDTFNFTSMQLDDGQVDFTYSGSSGDTTVTIYGLPENEEIGFIGADDSTLASASTNGNGVVTATLPNSDHTVSLTTDYSVKACGDYDNWADAWASGQFFDAVLCPYQSQLGGNLFGLLFFAPVAIGLFIYSGSVILPLTVGILLASVVAAVVPALAVQMGVVIVVFGVALAGTIFVKRRMETI